MLGGTAISGGFPNAWSPAKLNGLYSWYEGNITNNGTLVSAWPDRSGNAHHLTVTGGEEPGYTATGINNLPCVNFSGSSSKRLQLASQTIGSITFCFVCKLTTPAGELIVYQNDSSNPNYLYGNTSSSISVSRSFATTISNKNLSTNWNASNVAQTVFWSFGGTNATNLLYVGGTSQTLTSAGRTDDPAGNTPSTTIFIGANQSGGLPVKGTLGALIILNQAITATDVTKLYNYWHGIWGT